MRKGRPNKRTLPLECRELQAPLGKAEQTLRAPTEGEADAIVVSEPQGKRVFGSAGADRCYRALIETMNEGIVALLPGGVIGYSNRAFAELARTPLEQIVGSPFARFLPAEQGPAFTSLLERCGDSRQGAEFTLRAGDGSLAPAQLSAQHLEGDQFGRFCLVITDLTEQKKREQLRGHLAAIVESSDDAIYGLTLDGIIVSWNRGAERLYGYTSQEAIGRSVSLLAPTSRAGEPVNLLEKIKRQERVEHYETVRVRKDGRDALVSLCISPVKDAAGSVIGASAIARDITAQKQAARYARSLIEASLDPLVTISPDGKVTDVNEATVKVTGVPREKLVGTDFANYFTEPEKAREGYQRVFSQGFVTDYPLTIRHVEGRLTHVLYNASIYKDAQGNVLGVFAAARDITDRKKAGEALARRTEELARSNAELEQFASVASHDLQEPLRTVANFAQLLQERYKGRLDAKADEFIDFMVDGATRMQELINDLLAYARVGSRGREFAPADCGVVLEQALQNLQVAVDESGAQVTHDSLPIVECDRAQITQLFQNLVGNSIKFRSAQPPRIHVGVERRPSEWVFSVKDNGIGIDPQYADRVFEIFQRLHTRSEYPGRGVGLAIAKKIVERRGGRIWVESKLHQGATFFFTLPVSGGPDAPDVGTL
jgi:PAS domain S-box-containing protein